MVDCLVAAKISTTWDIQMVNKVYNVNSKLALGIEIVTCGWWMVSEILCIIGTIKNNKGQLIPFMIFQVFIIIVCIGMGKVFVSIAYTDYITDLYNRYISIAYLLHIKVYVIFLNLITLLIVLGLTIYVFLIVKNFYNELSKGITSEQQEGIMLQRYRSSEAVTAAEVVSTVYALPDTSENSVFQVSDTYQQQLAYNPEYISRVIIPPE